MDLQNDLNLRKSGAISISISKKELLYSLRFFVHQSKSSTTGSPKLSRSPKKSRAISISISMNELLSYLSLETRWLISAKNSFERRISQITRPHWLLPTSIQSRVKISSRISKHARTRAISRGARNSAGLYKPNCIFPFLFF